MEIGNLVKVKKTLFSHSSYMNTSGFYFGVIRGIKTNSYDVYFFYDREIVTILKPLVELSLESDKLSTVETKNYSVYKQSTKKKVRFATVMQEDAVNLLRKSNLERLINPYEKIGLLTFNDIRYSLHNYNEYAKKTGLYLSFQERSRLMSMIYTHMLEKGCKYIL